MVSGTFGLCLVRSPLNTCRGSLTWMCSDMGIMHPRASMYNQGTQTPTNLYILHVHDWGWHFTSPSLVNPLFSCLLFVVEFQTLSVPAVVCCAFLSFLTPSLHFCQDCKISNNVTGCYCSDWGSQTLSSTEKWVLCISTLHMQWVSCS